MRRLLTALLLLTLFAGCTKDEPLEPDDLYGLWKFQGYGSHLADVSYPADHLVWRNAKTPTLLLKIEGDEIAFSGKAEINTYFGSLRRGVPLSGRIAGYEATVITLNSTEKAGPPEKMQREQQYFEGIRQLKSLYVYRSPSDGYDQLLWMISETEYLSFVRKR